MTNDNIPLFRGKTFEGDWVYGSHVYSFKDKQSYITEHDANELSYAVQNETVGQFTGKYHNDGKQRFEGDVIFVTNGFGVYRGETYQVAMGGFIAQNKAIHCSCLEECMGDDSEVVCIGNIHDNPELMEAKMAKKKQKKCYCCGLPFCKPEEVDNVPEGMVDYYDRAEDGHDYCSECFRDEFLKGCVLCEEYFLPDKHTEDYRYFVQSMMDIQGIYKILQHPFMASNGFDVKIFKEDLELVKPLPDDQSNYYGFVCQECLKTHGIQTKEANHD